MNNPRSRPDADHQRWVTQLDSDLRDAGLNMLLDRRDNPIGADLGRYLDRLMETDFVAVIGTPSLLKKYKDSKKKRVVATELELVNYRMLQHKEYEGTVMPLLRKGKGKGKTSFPPQIAKLVWGDFTTDTTYFQSLFDLIWQMHDLPAIHPLREEAQKRLMSDKLR